MRRTTNQARSALAGSYCTDLARYLESPDLCPDAVIIDLRADFAEGTCLFSGSYFLRLIAEELNRRGCGADQPRKEK